MTYRNDITYTVSTPDGTRYEQHSVLDRPRALTARGAERILRSGPNSLPSAIVVSVSSCIYA